MAKNITIKVPGKHPQAREVTASRQDLLSALVRTSTSNSIHGMNFNCRN